MPIRRELLHLYPPNWPAISDRIRFRRARGRCECHGVCGRPLDHLAVEDGRCHNIHLGPRWRGSSRQGVVILSTAHLDRDPSNCADDNLLAMCEGCHLAYDRAHHWHTRREREYAEKGFVPLFDLAEAAG